MKKRAMINATKENIAPTIVATYYKAGLSSAVRTKGVRHPFIIEEVYGGDEKIIAVRGRNGSQVIEPFVLRRARTEQEMQRRHLHGDSGARFAAKCHIGRTDGVSNTITTVEKDNLLVTFE